MNSIAVIALLVLAIGINGERIYLRKGVSITPIVEHSSLENQKVRGVRPCGTTKIKSSPLLPALLQPVDTSKARICLVQSPADSCGADVIEVQNSPCTGGLAQVLDWRLTNCSADAICRLPRGGYIESELDFIPSDNISQLGLRFNLVHKDGRIETVVERPIADSAVVAGNRYTVHTQGGPTMEIESKIVTFQFNLYRMEDNSVELCSESEFHYD